MGIGPTQASNFHAHLNSDRVDGLVDVRAAFSTLWNRKAMIVFIALLTAAFGLALTSMLTPKYRAYAQLMLDPREGRITSDDSGVSDLEVTEQIIATEIAVLRSNLMVARVIEALDLDDRSEFSDPDAVMSLRGKIQRFILAPVRWVWEIEDRPGTLSKAQIIAAVQKHFSVDQVGISNAIEVRFESKDPDIAAAAANELVEVYIAHRFKESISATRAAAEWLSERTATMEEELKSLERSESDRRAEALQVNRGGRETVIAEASLMSSELASLRAVIFEKQTLLDHWTSMRAADGLLGVAAMIESDVFDELIARQSLKRLELAEAQRATGQNTTIFRRLGAELADIEILLEEEANRRIDALEDDLVVLRAREEALRSYSESLTERLLKIDRSMIDIVQAERESAAARAVYEALLIRLNETRVQEALGSAGAKQIVLADIPSGHALPRRGLTVLGFGFLGFSLAIGMVFFREARLDRFRSLADIERLTGLPVLAGLPSVRTRRIFQSRGNWSVARNETFSNQVRRIRSHLFFNGEEQQNSFMMVSSALPGEGKTEVSVCLANLLSLSDRSVLLIDCDFVNPRLSQNTGTIGQLGLCDVLSGLCSVGEAVVRPEGFSHEILPVGIGSASNQDLLSRGHLPTFLETIGKLYGCILLDAPPVHASADAQTLGKFVDQTLMVVDYTNTQRAHIVSAIEELRRSAVDIGGIAANRVPEADQRRVLYH